MRSEQLIADALQTPTLEGVEEEYEGQHGTAYHEAGHAIAAIKCPDGLIKSVNICERSQNNKENGLTVATIRDADEAFQLYAGPWAEARHNAADKPIDADAVWNFVRANEDDWTMFQRVAGNNVSDTDWTTMQLSFMGIGEAGPEYRPPQEWHDRANSVLTLAWDSGEVQDFAARMLARQKDIQLSNGQTVTRDDSRDQWSDPDYERGPDDGDGLVGPPPPN